jgi:hypothetical protein
MEWNISLYQNNKAVRLQKHIPPRGTDVKNILSLRDVFVFAMRNNDGNGVMISLSAYGKTRNKNKVII